MRSGSQVSMLSSRASDGQLSSLSLPYGGDAATGSDCDSDRGTPRNGLADYAVLESSEAY